MDSLVSYGSDDNSEDSGGERFPEMLGRPNNVPTSKNYRKPAPHEDNYEEVGMDMSEDSDDSEQRSSNQSSKAEQSQSSSSSLQRQNSRRSSSGSPKPRKDDLERRNKYGRGDRPRDDDRARRRDDRGCRSRDNDRPRREEDNRKDRYGREDRRDRRDDRYNRDRRDRRRSRSRDRQRSARSPRRSSRSPRRSRSGSRDRGHSRAFPPSRKEKADKRMDRLDKLGIQFKPDDYPASAIEEAERNSKSGSERFFMPGITGRFRDQIEKRKLLWQKAKDEDDKAPTPSPAVSCNVPMASGSKATKVYEATAFADDKTSNKFKRLMGIRKTTDTSSLPVKSTDVLKKQQEMFTSMEAQYEVARTATHTMRGVGLGFGSFQR